jgi:thiol-disulfide isomerase/thioredoxin
MRIVALALAVLLAGAALDAREARAGAIDWNDAGIRWRSYENGSAEARREGKPLVLIFYADWCPRCREYSALFRDPRVVERALGFVMVRVDSDRFEGLSKRHGPDGTYVPRTFFAPTGAKPDLSIQGGRGDYRYFLDPRDPDALLARMEETLARHRSASGAPPAKPEGRDEIVACPERGRTVFKRRSACTSL